MPRPTKDSTPTIKVAHCRCGRPTYSFLGKRPHCFDHYVDRLAAAYDRVFYDRGGR